VVKDGGGPGNGVMTCRTIRRREGRSGRRMHRIIGLLPGGQVACGVAAIGRRYVQGVVVVDMAVGAGHDFPRWGQLV